jgi:hypothetical protein
MVVAIARPPIAVPVEPDEPIDKPMIGPQNSGKSQFKRLTVNSEAS